MNISVCMENSRANIIYSTFLNFEAFYLNQHERNPNNIATYMNNCYLLIDGAYTILIDEFTKNKFVYYYTRGFDKPDKLFTLVKEHYPECVDLTIDHIKKMFSDIDKVRNKDFFEGNKYIKKMLFHSTQNIKELLNATKFLTDLYICLLALKKQMSIEKNWNSNLCQ